MSLNRRFVRYASPAAAGNAAGLRPFGALNGLAESGPGYKALVCIFMYGGNDFNNQELQLFAVRSASRSTRSSSGLRLSAVRAAAFSSWNI